MNVLLIEDETRVADFVTRGLQAEGWSVEHAVDGECALGLLAQREFDIVVLDLMLPGISGQDVCRTMRARKIRTPVIMLTALDAIDERVAGLRMGADDYLSKPFDFEELLARMEALFRRHRDFDESVDSTALEDDGLRFDVRSMIVSVDNETIDMTARERDMLKLFMSNPGKVLARERILNTVWGAQADPLTNVIDVYVGRLRKKLGRHGAKLQTVRGLGYRFGQ